MALRRLCRSASCPRYRLDGHDFCEKHLFMEEERDNRRREFFNSLERKERDPDKERLYSSTRWRKERRKFLDDCGVCAICGDAATDVHHEWGSDDYFTEELFFDKSHWIPLCRRCHSKITRNERWK